MKLFRRFRKPKSTPPKLWTLVHCPICKLELISRGCFVSDTLWTVFRCRDCGTESHWDFDAPVPLLIMWIDGGGVRTR